MHNKFTLHVRRLALTLIFACLGLIVTTNLYAQKWSGVNGNEWLDGKYSQTWARIGVNQKGIQRVLVSSLPAAFQTADKTKLALWHRGKQVGIIKADATEILFYGVPNDGSSDIHLYRLPVSRRNPYYSIYSDESAYFLTINPTENGLRAVQPTVTPNNPTALTSHIKTDLKKYQNEYSHSTSNYYRPVSFNSYFEEGKQATGTVLISEVFTDILTSNPQSVIYPNTYVPEPFSFVVKNYVSGGSRKVNVHLKSRLGSSTGEIYVGKDASNVASLRKVGTLNFTNMNDYDFTFDLLDGDYDEVTGVATLGFKASNPGREANSFSVSYFTVVYDQTIDMQNSNSYEFEFAAAADGSQSSVSISNYPAGTVVYDITDNDVPKIITSNPANFLIARNGASAKLLASQTLIEVPVEKISTVTFNNMVPSAYDYLIVSAGSLNTSANTYADYRRSTSPGKKYKPLVMNIKDIYNQFNYGEPSPVAIRRYVDYMISDNNKNKFLLLLGKSTTYFESSVREIPDEVPTVGFPGSDLLIVDGLAGTPDDVPAIPVGRVSAVDNQQVLDYLAKVTKYESESVDLTWRKKVIHMNGGKSTGEVTSFAGYMSGIASSVTNAPFSGTVIPKIKTPVTSEVVDMDFAAELNAGVGMISYFGHGNYNQTDYNAGYASQKSVYTNPSRRYPVLFYNGCGVNNVFIGLHDLSGPSQRTMSLDWLLAPNGAIIVFGNTWDAYASNSNEYLDRLYPKIFSQTDLQRKSIGEILKDVAAEMKDVKKYTYTTGNNTNEGYYDVDRANIHQILLQGDPAMRILLSDGPLPVKLVSFEAKEDQDKVKLDWKTASEKNNGRFEIERSYNAKNFDKIGSVEGKGTTQTETSYSFYDVKPLSGTSYYRLKQIDRNVLSNGQYTEGETTYSKIVSVTRDASNFLIVSPNPTADFVDIKLNAAVEVSTWELIDISGKIRSSGNLGQKVNLSNMESGEYILRIATKNGDSYSKKIVRK